MASCASPISLKQFRDALNTIWRPSPAFSTFVPEQAHILGIALSGGIDSMALAHLCSRLQEEGKKGNETVRLRFRAFVVDHKFRPESFREARKVAINMREMGIPVTILRLRSRDENPWKMKNFETEARRLRYQALGRACRFFRIRSLLCAHHDDDQAETILLRTMNRHTSIGLQGMKPAIAIPECQGLYGVYESGMTVPVANMPTYSQLSNDETFMKNESLNKNCDSQQDKVLLGTAAGGILLYRPLLKFSKDHLIATCRHSCTPWYDDPTNHDIGFTTRNTVRRLLQTNRLPHALRKPALLKLGGIWRGVAQNREVEADALFQKLRIRNVYLESGHVLFSMRDAHISEINNIHVAARFLEKIMLLVSPNSCIPESRIAALVKIMFPQFKIPGTRIRYPVPNESSHSNKVVMICCGGVRWVGSPPMETCLRQADIVWRIAREPIPRTQKETMVCRWARMSHPRGEQSCTGVLAGDSTSLLGTWQLWDNRYWLQPSHPQLKTLIVRPLQPGDLAVFRSSIRNTEIKRMLNHLLSMLAPKNERFTLPVLAENKEGPILGLPTLGIYLESLRGQLNCRVLYKKIDLPDRPPPQLL